MGQAAFTLIELLVVLAVIAMLAVTLLPALAGTRSNNQASQCLNNLRQWGVAMQIAASDNSDMIARDGTDDIGAYGVDTGNTGSGGPPPYPAQGSPLDTFAWFNALPGLVGDQPFSNYWNSPGGNPQLKLPFPGGKGKIWHCPTAKAAPGDSFLQGGDFGFFSYVMNIDLKDLTPITTSVLRSLYPNMPKLSSVPNPPATVFMTEPTFSPTLETYLATSSDASRNGIFPCARSYRFSKRHNDSGNLVFIDGHVAAFKRSYITNGAPNDSGVNRAEKKNPDVIWNIYR